MKKSASITAAYELACERYAALGVNVARALKQLSKIPISLHCWQGDDVGGFEHAGSALSNGLAVTGTYPGKARTPAELRADLEQALLLIPGKHRVNLHAFYGEFGGRKIDRDAISPEHFQGWIDWAKQHELGLDFNPTCFSHPKAADGFTLSHANRSIRDFWIEHCIRAREIGATMGRKLGKTCVTNVWIPDGYKDTPADREAPRARLADALDRVFKKKLPPRDNLDAVEPKLFGIGSESYVVGSHEFYLGYALTRKKLLTLDAGHYHPTEGIADKISSLLLFMPEILLHVSRGVRWDSDHVVVLNDDLLAIAREITQDGRAKRVHIGLDYFDASINRIAAWTIGARNMQQALLLALLETPRIRQAEIAGDLTTRLALQEDAKSLPFGAVWDYHCASTNVPVGENCLAEIKRYEADAHGKRR